MQNKDFDTLIEKYLNDQLTVNEKDEVELWLKHVADTDTADSLTGLEQEERGKRIFKAVENRITQPQVEIRSLSRKLEPVLKIAALVLLCCSMIIIFRSRLEEVFDIRQYACATNNGSQITKTILSDGSIVWLKGKSKLTYPVKFKDNLRNVDLEGEALFEVAKDPAHPFVIHCAGLSTRVLGTSFNIRHTSHKIEVHVLTGRVFLSSANSAAIILHPYQKAVYLELKKTIVKQVEPVIEVASLIKGTEYNMLFDDTPVEDVLERIEKKFEVKITLEKRKLDHNRITADFTDQSLLNTISMMSEAFNMDFRIDGQSVTLADKPTQLN
jgi:transmembrane sensor